MDIRKITAGQVAAFGAYLQEEGADYVNFGGQVSVPSDGLIALDNSTTDGQTVTIDGELYYKMVIQFAHKTKGADWALSVGADNPDNIVNYTFTVGKADGGNYEALQTYSLRLDYSSLTIS